MEDRIVAPDAGRGATHGGGPGELWGIRGTTGTTLDHELSFSFRCHGVTWTGNAPLASPAVESRHPGGLVVFWLPGRGGGKKGKGARQPA